MRATPLVPARLLARPGPGGQGTALRGRARDAFLLGLLPSLQPTDERKIGPRKEVLHTCQEILAEETGTRRDLRDQPLEGPGLLTWYTDGSSYIMGVPGGRPHLHKTTPNRKP
ncbi:Serine/threonine-protein kinase A-Raf [Manis javanica]|nr:Serine/threonine-protein kinase A-Raf [Manis javanica]